MTAHKHIAAILGLLSLAPASLAQGEWVLVRRDLTEQHVELAGLDHGELTFLDSSGNTRSARVSDLLALVHSRPPAERPPRELPWITRQLEVFGQREQPHQSEPHPFEGVIERTDGQRWVGALVSPRGQSVTWLVEGSLLLDAPLDAIEAAAIHGPIDDARASWDGLTDRVALTNGDLVQGFVATLGPQVKVETASAGAPELPIERVAGVLLANPPTHAEGTIVRTDAGSVIAVRGLVITPTGHVSAEAGSSGGGLGITTTQLRSIDFAPDAYAGLASIKPLSVTTPDGDDPAPARTVPDDTLGVAGLDLQGPVRIAWELPRPAARFAARATLPPAMWAWGDCELVVRTGDGLEAFRQRLNADRPEADIRVPLGGQTSLSIEIESGRAGAVQDRLVLDRPIVTWR